MKKKTYHQKAETDDKILVCLGCLKIQLFIPNKDFQKSTHAITGSPPQCQSLREVALDPGVTEGWLRKPQKNYTLRPKVS